MSCTVEDELTAYVDGELSAVEAARVRDHLSLLRRLPGDRGAPPTDGDRAGRAARPSSHPPGCGGGCWPRWRRCPGPGPSGSAAGSVPAVLAPAGVAAGDGAWWRGGGGRAADGGGAAERGRSSRWPSTTSCSATTRWWGWPRTTSRWWSTSTSCRRRAGHEDLAPGGAPARARPAWSQAQPTPPDDAAARFDRMSEQEKARSASGSGSSRPCRSTSRPGSRPTCRAGVRSRRRRRPGCGRTSRPSRGSRQTSGRSSSPSGATSRS